MPELPEVEVVRRGLAEHVVGHTISAVSVLHPRAIRRHLAGAENFALALVGQRVTSANRRGKSLWLSLSGGLVVVAHLGMSGQMLMQPAEAPAEKHLRVRFALDGEPAIDLRFVDQRTFGGLFIDETDQNGVPLALSHVAPDPFEGSFADDKFIDVLRSRKTEVKRALLDQATISGVGNIYADEALWLAQVHYRQSANTLTVDQATQLLQALRKVMGEALEAGGTSFDALYVNVNGQSGYFDRSLNAYGRENKPCARCGTAIVREPFMNRSSFLCPVCQSMS
ncbi:MAG: bifunctional DNA-formamidopyrimidine glycosylase/DNA-(apurinic or apyrimidinic site) lyase [Corynebacteriales bacterium]|nr:bifunctional DNA-formamidopyrimidine glycosylase/DNA-(apurinic or apyrimidinic site) lyase [Mycobacteriales bacterium]